MHKMHTTEDLMGQSRYCRTKSIQRENLERKFLEYYGVVNHVPGNDYNAFVFPSGMSAISTVMQSLSDPNKSIVIGEELYCDTPKVAKFLVQNTFFKSVIPFSQIKDTDKIQLIHLETCSNPSGLMPDYERLAELKRIHNCIVVLDNTWLSGVSFNPIKKFGGLVDVVIESTSKYLSAGNTIGGMCVCRSEHHDKIFGHIRMFGIHVPATICDLVSDSMSNVEERIAKSSQNTSIVLDFVKKHKCELTYPQKTDSKYNPSVFVISVPIPHAKIGNSKKMSAIRSDLLKLCQRHAVPFETSFGGPYSKLDTFPKMSSDKKMLQLRLYIGVDDDTQKMINLLSELI